MVFTGLMEYKTFTYLHTYKPTHASYVLPYVCISDSVLS